MQDGWPVTPFVSTNNTNISVSVRATLAATGAAFPFDFTNPHTYIMPPISKASGILGFDVGFAPVLGPPQCSSSVYGITKDSTRMLCIPPEEGYGSTARPGAVPANCSTLLIEIKCLQITPPPAPAPR